MNRNFLINLILILLFFFLQISFFQALLPPTLGLRLILITGLVLIFIDRGKEAFWWFIIGGLLIDLSSVGIFGLYTTLYLIIYLAISLIKNKLIHQPNFFLLILLLIAIISAVDLLNWLTDSGSSFVAYLSVFWRDLLVNFLFLWPIYLLFIYLNNWLEYLGILKSD